MSRHKVPLRLRPAWTTSETNDCLVSIGEEVYTARELACSWGADSYAACRQILAAGDKMRAILDDTKQSTKRRSLAGERALRKYWEAKSCARRHSR